MKYSIMANSQIYTSIFYPVGSKHKLTWINQSSENPWKS